MRFVLQNLLLRLKQIQNLATFATKNFHVRIFCKCIFSVLAL
jgi:hypothetical protein